MPDGKKKREKYKQCQHFASLNYQTRGGGGGRGRGEGFKKDVLVKVRTFFKKDSLQQRIFISQHQTLIGSVSVSRLQIVQVGFVNPDCLLELLDVLGATLAECGLGLSVALFALL